MRAVWSELVPYERLARPEVLRLLADRDLALYLAVTPKELSEVETVLRAARDHGVEVAVWPMLPHAEGRWPSVANVEGFAAFTLALLDRLEAARVSPSGVAIDLEPSIAELPDLLAARPAAIMRRVRRRAPVGAVERLSELRQVIEARGIDVFVAAFPFVVNDAREGWQRFLGTPVDALGAPRVTAMIYTSMIEGYARGQLSRRDAQALLHAWAVAMRSRYPAPSVSLGCVGTGILGEEPSYRDEAELAADVAAVRAAGVDDLVLFSLCGCLARPPAERWLDAFVAAEPAMSVPITPRARVVLAVVRAAGALFGLLSTEEPSPPR
jgi:hypothetical protein